MRARQIAIDVSGMRAHATLTYDSCVLDPHSKCLKLASLRRAGTQRASDQALALVCNDAVLSARNRLFARL